MALSGPEWVTRFPPSRSLNDLAEPFRSCANRFVTALRAAGATVTIADTLRPPQRAYLMHYAFAIAREGLDPAAVPPLDGVDIQWAHANGRTAAEQMVTGYQVVFRPVLKSRHTEGRAIDMDVTWQGALTIVRGDGGGAVTIAGLPRTGAGNPDLHKVGASYGVIKLLTDAPHWSEDGH